MPFIKIYPLQEATRADAGSFGTGDPARCTAVRRFDAREYFLNIREIAAFEECPLYLSSPAEPNALVNGIRLRLTNGDILVVADDPAEDEPGFLELLQQAAAGKVAEMAYSSHLLELERKQLL